MAVTTLELARISLTSADADALASFYESGLGFTRTARTRVDAALYGMEGSEALVVTLALGQQLIELVQFDRPGAPYPATHTSYDPWFQHIAIVVSDINAALQRLQAQTTPIPISLTGPVTLPASSGGVTAIKLRDPELHPFELLQFPAGAMPPAWDGIEPAPGGYALGIDHSAIVVSDIATSSAFYGALGLSVTSNTTNQGAQQDSLDAATGVVVEVVGMSPSQATPHVELLCYSAPAARAPITVSANDVAATRLVMRSVGMTNDEGPLLDPDGHTLLLVGMRVWEDPVSSPT